MVTSKVTRRRNTNRRMAAVDLAEKFGDTLVVEECESSDFVLLDIKQNEHVVTVFTIETQRERR